MTLNEKIGFEMRSQRLLKRMNDGNDKRIQAKRKDTVLWGIYCVRST